MRKKGGRLVQSTLSKIGAADRTVDRHFEEEEQRFRALDKALRALGKNVDAHLEGIKEELSAQVELAQAICDLYSDLPVRAVCYYGSYEIDLSVVCDDRETQDRHLKPQLTGYSATFFVTMSPFWPVGT